MLQKVITGQSEKMNRLQKFPLLLLSFILVSGSAAFGQEAKTREFINPKNNLRYKIEKNDTSLIVDKMAVFPGGEGAMMKYLQKKIVYPEASRKYGKEGVVKAKFVVNKTGGVEQIAVVEGLDKHTDSVVVKIIKDMPAWEPAMQGQTPLAMLYYLPVRFTLLNDAEQKNVREYQTDGIAFQHFKKWEVTRSENDGKIELKLERKGFGNGGLIYVNIEKDTMSAKTHLDKKLAHLTRNNDTSHFPFLFNASEKSTFSKHPAWKASGLMKMNAVATNLVSKYLIDVYTFKAGGKNIAITYLQFEEDREKTNLDFGVFQSSFKVKE